MEAHKYSVGTTFIRYGRKNAVPETIVDVYTTINLAGDVVKVRYVTVHKVMGQDVYDYDVLATTIARSLAEP